MNQRRGDIISSGKLSQQTASALHVIGIDADDCNKDPKTCIEAISTTKALNDEQRLSSASELWLMRALQKEHHANLDPEETVQTERRPHRFDSFIEAARQAYAYLFYTDRPLDKRALEDRQNQVRDFYNYASQRAIVIMSDKAKHRKLRQISGKNHLPKRTLDNWQIEFDTTGMQTTDDQALSVSALTPDYRLNFDGLRNQYVQDGLGARMVASLESTSPTPKDKSDITPSTTQENQESTTPTHSNNANKPWKPMRYISVTALLKFPGNNLDEVLSTDRAVLSAYDTWQDHDVIIRGHHVPLAANYTAAYGLWLANSDFSSQSILSLFGRGNILEEPRIYLMQPYHPERKTIILVHGLASSPEAWVNAANEIMGDETLRRNYQIWQVYYPTSVPLAINRYDIATAIEKTFDYYDPDRKNPASHNSVIIGHSMGGILSRLMVSNSGDVLWETLKEHRQMDNKQQTEAREKLHDYIYFSPLPEISRAIFIAAPHRGTPFADKTIARFIASLVKLPINIVQKISDTTRSVFGGKVTDTPKINGVDNLSEKDPTIQALAMLKISPDVIFHSIMGNNTPDVPLAESSDGIVPYSSSHWDGAASELVIPSGHSVQETPKAIIEIRRILHEHLGQLKE
ncbi:MAG: alpha/beta hydrolase [Oxalobacter sp.]|nr:alpha/beta hydrolase [Oxalobacter sp.]